MGRAGEEAVPHGIPLVAEVAIGVLLLVPDVADAVGVDCPCEVECDQCPVCVLQLL